MKTTSISHTVLSENPVSAQRIDSVGVGATRRSADAVVTATSPTTGPGSGSVTSAATTATNSAK